MKTHHLSIIGTFAFGSMLLAGTVSAQWSFIVPETDITDATGNADMDSAEIASDGQGRFAVIDTEGTDEVVVFLDPSRPAGTVGTVLANTADMKAAIDAANGTSPDYDLAAIRIQGIEFNSAGNIAVFMDDGTNAASVILLVPDNVANPSSATINVLSTSVDGAGSPVEGGNAMFVGGDIVYLLVEGSFGAAEDAVLSIDTSIIVNDGSATVSTVAGEAELLPAAGQTAGDYRHTAGAALSTTEILVCNSGLGASNDDILLIDLTGPTVSNYIQATAVEAALSTSDVGYGDLEVDADGNLYLLNQFGNGAEDDGVIIIDDVLTSASVTASIQTEATIAGDVGASALAIGKGAISFDKGTGRLNVFSGGTGTEGVISLVTGSPEIDVTPASVDFTTQDIASGPTAVMTITVQNTGTAELDLTDGSEFVISGTDAVDFAIANSPSTGTLTVGSSVSVDLTFDPTTVGSKTASLDISSNDADESTVQVSLTGEGTTISSVNDWLVLD